MIAIFMSSCYVVMVFDPVVIKVSQINFEASSFKTVLSLRFGFL